MFLKRLFIIFHLFFPLLMWSQQATYKVMVGRFNVGQQTVVQSCNGDTLKITVHSDVKLHLGFTNYITYNQKAVYYKNQLLFSNVVIQRNQVTQSHCSTKWTGTYYTINLDGKKSRYNKPITLSGTRLYFEQPLKNQEVFSESDGKMKNLVLKPNGEYELSHPGEKAKNSYHYKNGVLQKTTIHHPLISFSTELLHYHSP